MEKVPGSDFVAVWIKMGLAAGEGGDYAPNTYMWDGCRQWEWIVTNYWNLTHKSPPRTQKENRCLFKWWGADFISAADSMSALVWHFRSEMTERQSETSLFAQSSGTWYCLNQGKWQKMKDKEKWGGKECEMRPLRYMRFRKRRQ